MSEVITDGLIAPDTGNIYQSSGKIIDENTIIRTVYRSFVSATTSGNTQLVAAQSGLRIRVLSASIVCLLAVTVKFQSATTDISPGFPFGAKGGISIPRNQDGIMQTEVGEALNINLSIETSVGCLITWFQTT